MFNLGGSEVIVILLVALIILGPDKLPETARKIGNVMGELRRMSSGFQQELRSAVDDAVKDKPPTSTPTSVETPAGTPAEIPTGTPAETAKLEAVYPDGDDTVAAHNTPDARPDDPAA